MALVWFENKTPERGQFANPNPEHNVLRYRGNHYVIQT
jgi:hypothetical protein